MKKTLTIIAVCLIANYALSQAFKVTFGGAGDDRSRAVRQTYDGGYIIVGSTKSFGAGGADVYLIRTDANGDSLWTKTYGGAGEDIGRSVQQTTDSGFIITGYTKSFGAGATDVYLIKTDASGDTIWTKTYGGKGDDWGYSVSIVGRIDNPTVVGRIDNPTITERKEPGYIIAGQTRSFGIWDVYLIRTNVNGDTLWTKTFGGTGAWFGRSLQTTFDGGYIIIGHSFSMEAENIDICLIRTNANGDTLWTKTLGGLGYDGGYSVSRALGSEDAYVITGGGSSFGPNVSDVYLIKVIDNGDILWTKTFGQGNKDFGNSVSPVTGNDIGYIIAGYTASWVEISGEGKYTYDVFLLRTDSDGNKIWTKTFGGKKYDVAYSVQQTADGGFIIAGETKSFGAGKADVYLIKVDKEGN